MYEDGKGVEENGKIAVHWYTLAAKQGHAQAQTNLGFMYEDGSGIAKDRERAYMWYNLSAINGNKRGTKNKDQVAKLMTTAAISKAEKMSKRCLDSDYAEVWLVECSGQYPSVVLPQFQKTDQ